MLKVGDIIELRTGHKIYTEVPECFVFENMGLSKVKSHHEIIVNKKYNAFTIDIYSLITDVYQAFLRVGFKADRKAVTKFVNAQIGPKRNNNEIFCFNGGKFVVIKTKLDGGSTGRDPYPDGHHVFVKRLKKNGSYDKNGDEADFYQSGYFTAMIKEHQITVLGHMEIKFV